jgi:hypothetical protein
MDIQKIKEWKAIKDGAEFEVLTRVGGKIDLINRFLDGKILHPGFLRTVGEEKYFINELHEDLIHVTILKVVRLDEVAEAHSIKIMKVSEIGPQTQK